MLAFLTVGSTRFDSLIASAFTPRFLSALQRKGYSYLVVQCGNSSFELATEIQNGETRTLDRAGVHIEYWKFKPSLQGEYEKADLVISHAGVE
jgi:beta-1,4-N-acetylglucosaminyltransferase